MTKYKGPEKRRYIRLDSVFPVDFRLIAQDDQTFLSDWIQGFTNNISEEGICLSVNNLKLEFVELIQKGQVNLSLNMQIPLSNRAARAKGVPIWIRPVSNQPGQYAIGLSYSQISTRDNRRIVGYTRMRYLLPRLSYGLLIILALGIGISGYFNWRLTKDNRNLIHQLVQVLENSKLAQDTISKINKEKEELNSRLTQIQVQIKGAEDEKEQLSEQLGQMQLAIERKESQERVIHEDTQRLTLLIEQLERDKGVLQKR